MMRIGVLFGLLLLNGYTYGLSPVQVRQLSNQATQAIAQNNFDTARTIIQQLKDASQGAIARQLETSLIQAQSTQAAQQAKTTITQGQTDSDKLYAELKEKGSRLGETIKELRTANQQIAELNFQIETAQKTNANLQQQIKDQQAALQQALDKNGQDALAAQIAILKKQSDQEKAVLENKLRVAEEKKQEATNESNKNEHELTLIKKQLDDATKDKEGLRAEYQKGIDQLKKEQAQELEKLKTGDISDLKKQLDDKTKLHESCSTELDKVHKEQVQTLTKLDTTGAELRNTRQDLEKALYEKKQLEQEKSSLPAAQAKAIADATKTLQDKITQLEVQLTKTKADQDTAIKDVTKNLQTEREKALQELSNAVAELKEQKLITQKKDTEIKKYKNQEDAFKQQKALHDKAFKVWDAVNDLYKVRPDIRDYDSFEYTLKAIETAKTGEDINKRAEQLKKEDVIRKNKPLPQPQPKQLNILPTQPVQVPKQPPAPEKAQLD